MITLGTAFIILVLWICFTLWCSMSTVSDYEEPAFFPWFISIGIVGVIIYLLYRFWNTPIMG